MEIKIKRVENGWILEKLEKEEFESGIFVYSFSDDEKSEAEAFTSLLWNLKEMVGPEDSRYSEHRVRIGIEPGDKFPGLEEGCPV